MPDANTLGGFRETLIGAASLDERLEQVGEKAVEIWSGKPATTAREDTGCRPPQPAGCVSGGEGMNGLLTIHRPRRRTRASEAAGTSKRDLAIPTVGYKSHAAFDRRQDFISRQNVMDAAAHDGTRLRETPGRAEQYRIGCPSRACWPCPFQGSERRPAGLRWADTTFRSKTDEDFLSDHRERSRIHCRKPAGKPMSKRTARANARKSKVRATVEHVFAQQKDRLKPTIRSIGLERAEATIIMANNARDMGRRRWAQGRTVFA